MATAEAVLVEGEGSLTRSDASEGLQRGILFLADKTVRPSSRIPGYWLGSATILARSR